ncbi:hypothetical protein H8N03_04800 [Ramlibacter sp. USB13]|uniref:DUF1236 domain-containing protein n=1 Tax=Ramlibacter cellulosilyticus TaxID=2764187 RepID=A0A923MMB5_9BURK|nr:hypothetical protein [Ramlibacter cellulosilyticus]MBC5782252.1 hypothetical protein [Ramlibacter cellulosilyticus]
MHVMFRLPPLAGAMLLATLPIAWAESPLPDPVAPAVLGRPLDQIKPAAKATRPKPVTAKPVKSPQAPATSTLGASRPFAAPVAVAAPSAQQAPSGQHVPKQALDDRADPRHALPDNVGKGTHLARKPLGPGAYFSSKAQTVVRRYYDAHPASARAANWQIGEPIPSRAKVTGVPDAVRVSLPPVPPGHQYVQVDGEVVLVAMQSRMVVDGISRAAR